MNTQGVETCQPSSVPCPVFCASGEKKCTEMSSDGTRFEYCELDSENCPVLCRSSQQVCQAPDGAEKCFPLNRPCPVVCDTSTEVKCFEPAMHNLPSTSWCQENTSKCPLFCKVPTTHILLATHTIQYDASMTTNMNINHHHHPRHRKYYFDHHHYHHDLTTGFTSILVAILAIITPLPHIM